MNKTLKRIISVALCALLLVAVFVPAFAADEDTAALKFGRNGKFKILQVADLQDSEMPYPAMIKALEKILDKSNPDLVVLTGDNIAGGSCETLEEAEAAIAAFMAPIVERSIPFAVTFGNHDDEGAASKEDQLAIYQTYPGCLSTDDNPELTGCANNSLPVLSSDGKKVAFNVWMIDSNTYDEVNGGYDYVHEDQIAWYKETSKKLEEENGGLVPSIAFQHIVVPEIYELMWECDFESDITANYNGQNYYLLFDKDADVEGFVLEGPCPSNTNGGEMAAFLERGDVLATVCGHDHINEYVADYKGVDIICTPGMTFNSYGRYMVRGCRLFTIDESDTWDYETEMIHYIDVFNPISGVFNALYYGTDLYTYLDPVFSVFPSFNEISEKVNGIVGTYYNYINETISRIF